MVHACGIINKEKGLLFCGASGKGKSTLANFWIRENRAAVLSDDRIIIRRKESQFWIFGTPWHGDSKTFSPEKVQLERIFFLNHARENKVVRTKRTEAAAKLLVCSFPTFWDKKGMEFTLGFIDELTREVPCYDLGFLSDKSVIDIVSDI